MPYLLRDDTAAAVPGLPRAHGLPRLVRWAMAAGVLVALTAAGAPTCAVCGETVQGRFLQADGKAFCSRECYRTTLPVCAVCDKVIEGAHLVFEGHHFCSEACYKEILPTCAICQQPLQQLFHIQGRTYCKTHAEGPRCDACGMPVGKTKGLPDGRLVCRECRPTLVFDAGLAATLYGRAGQALAVALGQPLPSAPPLLLVGRDKLPVHHGLEDAVSIRELGRYVRESQTTTSRNLFGMALKEETRVTRKILILYGLKPDSFICTAVHELTHDLLAERYPAFSQEAPDWVEEGLCQYTAALVCRRLGYADRVREIETSPDPVYGHGYRYLVRRFGEAGWAQLSRWLDTRGFAGLPAEAPPSPAP